MTVDVLAMQTWFAKNMPFHAPYGVIKDITIHMCWIKTIIDTFRPFRVRFYLYLAALFTQNVLL